MKKLAQQDERTLAQKRKVESEAFNIIWMSLLISILVQQYFLKAPFEQYAVEVILFISGAVYFVVRYLLAGYNLFDSKKEGQYTVIVSSLICGAIVTVITTTLNYIQYGQMTENPVWNTLLVALITFISAVLLIFAPLEFVYLVNKKKQKNIESDLDENE